MPALVAAEYRVIVPNEHGYSSSSQPTDVADYDIEHSAGDLVALLEHYVLQRRHLRRPRLGCKRCVVAELAASTPSKPADQSELPYQERGEKPWIEWMEEVVGGRFYFVHCNRQLAPAS